MWNSENQASETIRSMLEASSPPLKVRFKSLQTQKQLLELKVHLIPDSHQCYFKVLL